MLFSVSLVFAAGRPVQMNWDDHVTDDQLCLVFKANLKIVVELSVRLSMRTRNVLRQVFVNDAVQLQVYRSVL